MHNRKGNITVGSPQRQECEHNGLPSVQHQGNHLSGNASPFPTQNGQTAT